MKYKRFIYILVYLLIVGMFVRAFDVLNIKSKDENLMHVKNSLNLSVKECYAIEGNYPESLDYLRENYGVYINDEAYQIHYRYLGANLMPEIKVFEKGEKR